MGWLKDLICKVHGHRGHAVNSSVLRLLVPTDIFAMSDNVKVDFSEVVLRIHNKRCGCGFTYTTILDPIVKPYSSVSFERTRQFKDTSGNTLETSASSTVGRYVEFMLPKAYENFVNVNTFDGQDQQTAGADWPMSWFLDTMTRVWEDDPDLTPETLKLLKLIDAARKQMSFLVDSAIRDPIGRFESVDMLRERY